MGAFNQSKGNNMSTEWAKNKAEELIRHEIDVIRTSRYPTQDTAVGMIELAYATGLIDDAKYGYFNATMHEAITHRRAEVSR